MTGHGALRLVGAALGAVLAWAGPSAAAEPAVAALTLAREAPARLVLDHAPAAGWIVRQSGRQVELRLPGAPIAVATGAIPLPAGQGALTALESETGADGTLLRLGLGCACTAAVRTEGGRLIIDILGAEPGVEPSGRAGAAPRLARRPQPRPAGTAGPVLTASRRQLEETRNRLLHDLRRAAEAGLVTLRQDGSGLLAPRDGQAATDDVAPVQALAPPAAPEAAPEAAPAAVPEAAPAAAPAAGPEAAGAAPPPGEADAVAGAPGPGASVARAARPDAPVRLVHGAPRPLAGPGPEAQPFALAVQAPAARTPAQVLDDLIARAPASGCLPSEAFMLPDRLPREALIGETGRLRRALLGEFDRADPEAALGLARLYIAHGLGVEAERILVEFAPARPEAPLLAAMAELVEARPLPGRNLLAVEDCVGQHALWQALDAALAGRTAEAVALEAAASGALEQVGSGLRGRIAVRLGLAAADAGEWVAAHRLDAMARRGLAPHDHAGAEMERLLTARVRLGQGDRAGAVGLLAGLVGGRSRAAAEATLQLAGLLTEPGAPAAADAALALGPLRQDLGALVTRHRGTPLGRRAFRAELAVTGRLLGRDAALDLLAYGREAALLEEVAYRDLLAGLGSTMPAAAGDTPLAVLYERDRRVFAPLHADAGFRRALARSYLSLGAPALAEGVLEPGDLTEASLVGALADGYLALGETADARRLAARLPEGPVRAGLEAGVLMASGEAGAALAAAGAAGMAPAERARMAWAARAWLPAVEALAAAAAGPGRAGTAVAPVAGGDGEARAAAPPAGPEKLAARDGAAVFPAGGADAAGGPGGAAGLSEDAAEPAPPDPRALALRLALAAERAGRAGPPGEALALVTARRELAAGLDAIFEPDSPPPTEPGPELSRLIERTAAEARLYREILDDG